MPFPFHTEPTHVEGDLTTASTNGFRNAAHSYNEGSHRTDISNDLAIIDSESNPLLTTVTNVGRTYDGKSWGPRQGAIARKPSESYKFEELTDFMPGRVATVSGTYAASGDVTVTLTGAGTTPAYIFVPGDLVRNARTGEVMVVATVASATTITVAAAHRGFGTTAASAGADGDHLFLTSSLGEEGGVPKNANSTVKRLGYNYIQCFQKTYAMTDLEAAISHVTGDELSRMKRKTAIQHARDIESAFVFGERKEATATSGHKMNATGGIREGILTSDAYVQDQNGTISVGDFNTFIKEGGYYTDSNKRWLVGGSNILMAAQNAALNAVQTSTGDTTFGVKITSWVSPLGEISFLRHPMFTLDYAGEAMQLDMSCLKYRFINGLDTHLNENILTNGQRSIAGEYVTYAGLERRTMEKCAYIRGIDG
jgi:hypothetical protein